MTQVSELERWRAQVVAVLRRSGRLRADEPPPQAPERLLARRTADGLELPPLGTARTSAAAGLPDPGLPGSPPFVRGAGAVPAAQPSTAQPSTAQPSTAQPSTARPDGAPQARTDSPADPQQERPGGWDVRQRISGADPDAVHAAALADLENGTTSLWLDVGGPGGVALDQLGRALADVRVDIAPMVLRTHVGTSPVRAARALLELLPDGAGDGAVLGLGGDPLARRARTGRPADDGEHGRGEVLRLAELAAEHGLGPGALVVDALPYHQAGGTDGQVLACALAAGVEQLRWLLAAGVDPATAARMLEWRLPATDDQLGTVAALRAARVLWGRATELLDVPEPARGLRVHAVTSPAMLARRDPWVNLLRATVAALAAGVGGAQAVTVLPFDAALGASDAFARRVARNTASVLLAESSLGRQVDPAGGAHAVEERTWALAEVAWQRFADVERSGGLAAVLEDGSLVVELDRSWQERRHRVATRAQPLTGVSEFPDVHEEPVVRPPDPAAAAEGSGGLPTRRWAQEVEALRDRADALVAVSGEQPSALVVRLGTAASASARAGWSGALLAVGGVLAAQSEPLDPAEVVAEPDDALAAVLPAADGHADGSAGAGRAPAVAVVAGADAAYPGVVGPTAAALRRAGARLVLVAGGARVLEDGDREAVDGVAAAGDDVVALLGRVLDALGAPAGDGRATPDARDPSQDRPGSTQERTS